MKVKTIYLLNFVIVFVILALALYLEFFHGLIPCPLCLLQRGAFYLLSIFFILGFIFHKRKYFLILINSLCVITTLLGITVAGRQIWLQSFSTSQGEECSASIHYLLQVLPLQEVAKKIFAGSADCNKIDWTFLSLSMAQWSMLAFVFFFCMSITLFFKIQKKKN